MSCILTDPEGQVSFNFMLFSTKNWQEIAPLFGVIIHQPSHMRNQSCMLCYQNIVHEIMAIVMAPSLTEEL